MSSAFESTFGAAPEARASAPGRVNLLGEHTDYNDGFVLPMALPLRTTVTVGHAAGKVFTLRSRDLDRSARFSLDALPDEAFARYVYGCLRELERKAIGVPALNLLVESDLPMNAGLSSSAALEVATLRAVGGLLAAALDPIAVARMGQRAEQESAGVDCGIMDQMAASVGEEGVPLLIDTRTLEARPIPLPDGAAVLVLDSGIARTLAGSAFNERRRECSEAAAQLGVASLRDVVDLREVEKLPEPLRRRARHVLTENDRVLRAAATTSAAEFGRLMNASHASLRDDFEVSVPGLDTLVELLQAQRAVFGARLTGAGFGGACIALCEATAAHDVAIDVLRSYAERGGNGKVLAGGARSDARG